MISDKSIRQNVEKAFDFMIKTASVDGRGGRHAMEWHAKRVIDRFQHFPSAQRKKVIEAAKACARSHEDELIAHDARLLRDLILDGLVDSK